MSLDSVAVSPESRRAEALRRPPVHRVGIAGLLLAAFAVILEVLAIVIGSGSGKGTAWGAATVIAWFVIGLQAVSFVLGLVAILGGRGRGRGRSHGWRFGLAAVVLSLLANPLLLVGLFSLIRDIS
jgi:hypothetical protein